MTEPPSYTCPICGRTSHNPNDVEHSYCGHCHVYEREALGVLAKTSPLPVEDHFVEGMFYGPDGEPLSTLQWSRLYEQRYGSADSPTAVWRAGLDLIDGVLEVSTVWDGVNKSILGIDGIWETLCFWTDPPGWRPISSTQQRWPDRASAVHGHQETVARLTDLGADRFRRLLDVIDENDALIEGMSGDAAVWRAGDSEEED